jgi:3D (Asp-Asp-Asp) domain-containing protein
MTSSTTATQAQSITTSGGITSTPIQQNYITIAVIATVILLITVMLVMRRRNNV